jgi:peptidoglycan/xylan/chitin deacetylase (PgdA/CDA1 family)
MAGAGPRGDAAMSTAVLMYHAVTRDGAPVGADPHYAVSAAALREHLARLRARGFRARAVLDVLARGEGERTVGMTFDDGHISNFDTALEILLKEDATADFFVNPSTVGKADQVSWAALRQMAAAGMSIQSHGHTHRYFDELSDSEVRDELARSKAEIEDKVGCPVSLFAPPGGRINATVHRLARELGYRAVCTSRPGLWRAGMGTVPRFPVLASTPAARIEDWASGTGAVLVPSVASYWVRYAAKTALGNALYERVRARLLRARG